MAEQVRLTAIVKGRVQGVYFRNFVQKHAVALGVNGYVHNLPDFTKVEIQAEGDVEKLKSLLNLMQSVPPGAEVEQIETKWLPYEGTFKNFDIRY